MRLNRWLCAAGSLTMVAAGVLVEQACSTGNYCSTSDGTTTCYLYTALTPEGGTASGSSGTGASSKSSSTVSDASVDANDGGGVAPFGPGTGTACDGGVGTFPASNCDPSDETACMGDGGANPMCPIATQCGNPNTCEPFVTNPPPGKGVENFRMRVINLTAPPSLANATVQGAVVTPAVDLPADGGACGENGTGLFNWLISVDEAKGTVTTGGAPPSADPFTTGFCYLHASDGTVSIGAQTVDATFKETTAGLVFNTKPIPNTLNIPIFLPDTNLQGVVLLPIRGAAFNDVTISANGDCIGSVNNGSIVPSSAGPCTDPAPTGGSSCSRWHTAGSFAGYITLTDAEKVIVASLGNESLCVLLTGMRADGGLTCPEAAFTSGNYCSKTLQPGGCGDSYWLSAQFAASAVNIIQGDSGVPLCNGASITPTTN